MKKLYTYIFISISILFFSGCEIKSTKIDDMNYKITTVSVEEMDNAMLRITCDMNFENNHIDKTTLQNLNILRTNYALKSVAEITLRRDYNYFAILNQNISNILGFPIDNIKDFNSFMFKGYDVGEERYYVRLHSIIENKKDDLKETIEFYTISFKEKPKDFPTWDAKKTLEEADEILYNLQ